MLILCSFAVTVMPIALPTPRAVIRFHGRRGTRGIYCVEYDIRRSREKEKTHFREFLHKNAPAGSQEDDVFLSGRQPEPAAIATDRRQNAD